MAAPRHSRLLHPHYKPTDFRNSEWWDLTRSLNSQTVNASAGFYCGEREQVSLSLSLSTTVVAVAHSRRQPMPPRIFRAGTRSGGIRFFTTRDRQFFHHMTSWPLKQKYAIEVASGLCVGLRGRAGADIDALGLTFLLPISHARLTNVRYPTLQLEAASIHPVNIHEFYDENLS
ncbi:hypothetical protein KP509_09G074900 [Ceratopteris richardii]|uniref:Uncharacterized protein n=1 Tax=Ceratopteris richardii TaxID=49495 RepID=A0A8T2U874_CERRI|nr:hypothetical protein KP509_09G074900 [Ceratopteris richardii]